MKLSAGAATLKLIQQNEVIRKLRFEIRKRDNVIHNLRESKELLYRSGKRMLAIMEDTAEEDLDYDILKTTGEVDLAD